MPAGAASCIAGAGSDVESAPMADRPLWAPWRAQYVAGPKSGDCVFCAAAAGREPELVVQRGERCFMMLNAFPYASGHLMVAPYRHAAQLEELDEQETGELMRLARQGILALREVMSPAGFNLGLNLGEVAGAGISDHLHLHVVPRWHGDTNFMPVIADTRVISQALDATAQALRNVLDRET
jgi:ATP adenylyltransferase